MNVTHGLALPVSHTTELGVSGAASAWRQFTAQLRAISSTFITLFYFRIASGATLVNAKVDLIPLCPNCHAVTHLDDPPLSLELLKRKLTKPNSRLGGIRNRPTPLLWPSLFSRVSWRQSCERGRARKTERLKDKI